MTISIQTLNDTLVALVVTVGVAVALSLAFVAVSAFIQRGRARVGHAVHSSAPAQQATQTDQARDLVLR